MGELQFSDKFSDTQKSSSIIVNQTYSYIHRRPSRLCLPGPESGRFLGCPRGSR